MNSVVQVNKVLIDRVRDLCRKSFTADVQAFRDIEAALPPIDGDYVIERLRSLAEQRGTNPADSEMLGTTLWEAALLYPDRLGHITPEYIQDDCERKNNLLAALRSMSLLDLDKQLKLSVERQLMHQVRRDPVGDAIEMKRIQWIKDNVQLRGAADAVNMSVEDVARLALTKLTFASSAGGDGTRWTSKTVDAYLGTLNDQEAQSVLQNAGEYVVKHALRPETLRYAVIEISDLKSAAFRDLGGQAQMVSILREVGHSMIGRMVEPTRFSDVAMELPVRDVNYNEVGRYLVMTGAQLDALQKSKPDALVVAVNIEQASLLIPKKAEVTPNGDLLDRVSVAELNKTIPSGRALDQVQAVSQQFLLLANDFEGMAANHDLLSMSFKTASVQVVMPEGGLLIAQDLSNKDSVFSDAKFIRVDGYLKTDKASFVDALCCIGDVGDLDNLSEGDEAINDQILHYFASQAEFDASKNGEGFDFVITKEKPVLLNEVIASVDAVEPSL